MKGLLQEPKSRIVLYASKNTASKKENKEMHRLQNRSNSLAQNLALGLSALVLTTSVALAGGMPEGYAASEPEPALEPIFKQEPKPMPISEPEPEPEMIEPAFPKYQVAAYGGLQSNLDGSVSGNVGGQPYSFDTDWQPNFGDLEFSFGLRATRWDSESGGWQIDYNDAMSNAQSSDLVGTQFSELRFETLNITTISRIFRLGEMESAAAFTPYFGMARVLHLLMLSSAHRMQDHLPYLRKKLS